MAPPHTWLVRGRTLTLDRPLVMGVVNVTPDSFSDGGRYLSADAAVAHGRSLLAQGADILDIGGESTRPQGAVMVSVDDELDRVIPVITTLAASHPHALLSVDTVKSRVAEAALRAGASIVNDVSALRLDPRMAGVVASLGAGVILMHSRGDVSEMGTYLHADYEGDVLDVVRHELETQLNVARRAGVPDESIVLDPGVGFSKRPEASLRMLGCLQHLASLGRPIAVGASRKRVIGSVSGVSDPSARAHGSVGAAVAAYERGAAIFRVHDVAATRQALDVAAAIRRASEPSIAAVA
jgi:dihydropteroate synthase